jgi:hypothetical protein
VGVGLLLLLLLLQLLLLLLLLLLQLVHLLLGMERQRTLCLVGLLLLVVVVVVVEGARILRRKWAREGGKAKGQDITMLHHVMQQLQHQWSSQLLPPQSRERLQWEEGHPHCPMVFTEAAAAARMVDSKLTSEWGVSCWMSHVHCLSTPAC